MRLHKNILNKNLEAVSCKLKANSGFTLLELLVVIAIMATVSTLVLANYNSWRSKQSLRQAQTGLITALQTYRSHSLSARQVATSQAAFYYVKLDTATPTRYQVGAVTKLSVDGTLTYQDTPLETINFTDGVVLDELELTIPIDDLPANPNCVHAIFSLPYGQVYFNDSCPDLIENVSSLANLSEMSNGLLQVQLGHSNASLGNKLIEINALSGLIRPL